MRFLALAVLATLSVPAFSEEDIDESREDMPTSHPEIAVEEGWRLGLNFGILTDWDYNRHMTGTEEGTFLRLGGNLQLTASFLSGNHEWRNKVILAETYNLSPNINAFIKSNDHVGGESQWLWSLGGWWGTAVQVNADTSIFPGYDYHEKPTTYHVTDLNNVVTDFPNQTAFKLTDSFMPTYFKESVGFFARPVTSRFFTWEMKVTGYASQALSNGELEIESVDDNGEVHVGTLANFYQMGPSISTFFFGDVIPKMFFYQIKADLGYSFYESSVKPLGSDFSNHVVFNGMGSLTFKPAEWIALTWNVRAIYLPEISSSLEIDNKFFLSFPFSN